MQASTLSFRLGASTLAAVALLLGATGAKAETAPASDSFPLFDNYLTLGVRGTDISGNEAAFQTLAQQPKSGSAGIEDFHFGKDIDKTTSLVIDGRALAPSADYLGKFNVSKTDVGSFEMGYKSFRTYYDGVGGFFPLNNNWQPLANQDLHVDRGQFWVEGKIALPNKPVFTVRYSNETRTGNKDSTIWGSSDFTGLNILNVPYTQYRKLVPSYLHLDEKHQTFEGTMTHTVGNTTFRVVVSDEKVNNLDTRYVTNFPGEVIPWSIAQLPTASQPAAKALVSPANWNNQAITNQTYGDDTKTFTALATVETVFSEKFKVSGGFSYIDLTDDFSGDRPIWTSPPTAVGVVIAAANNNANLLGTTKGTTYTGNVAVDVTPTKNVSLRLSVRGEDEYYKSAGTLTSVTAAVNTATGVVTTTSTNQQNYSRNKGTSWTPMMDFSYTGIPNVGLYATASVRTSTGDYYYVTPYTVGTTPSVSAFNLENPSENHTYYDVGASWRQSNTLTLRADVFYKDHVTKASGYGVDVGNYYDLVTKFGGAKLTAIFKADPTLTFTTRYVYQGGKAQVTGPLGLYPAYDSMDYKNHTISETVDWTPNAQFYVQANVNVVFNTINTIYPRAGIAPAAGATPAWNVNAVLQDSNNNNVTASLLTGAVITKTDDLLFQVTYYNASNGNAYLASTTQPFGVSANETVVSVGLKHKFTDRLMGNLKVGYFDSHNATTGGFTDFHGPLGYISLTTAL